MGYKCLTVYNSNFWSVLTKLCILVKIQYKNFIGKSYTKAIKVRFEPDPAHYEI